MASEKKASEVIALLSMYNDEDDTTEDLDEEKQNIHEQGIPPRASDAVTVNDKDGVGDNGNENTPRQQEESVLNDSSTPSKAFNNGTVKESESAGSEDAVIVSVEEQKDVDLLDKFLPPPPKAKCSEELQEKINRFLEVKKTIGRSFNAEVRNRKEYRNRDFLLRVATYQDIDQIGSCFPEDVFGPHGYDKSHFYDEIEAETK